MFNFSGKKRLIFR